MHEELHVSNKGRAGRGLKLRPGLTLALEPWFARTTDRIVYDADGWAIRSAGRLAHGPLRAHGGHHRGRPLGAHPA
jgi:methionyl aminopeptidase